MISTRYHSRVRQTEAKETRLPQPIRNRGEFRLPPVAFSFRRQDPGPSQPPPPSASAALESPSLSISPFACTDLEEGAEKDSLPLAHMAGSAAGPDRQYPRVRHDSLAPRTRGVIVAGAYYPFYPGDSACDTADLSMLEHGAYRLLLDFYYSEERLPADRPGPKVDPTEAKIEQGMHIKASLARSSRTQMLEAASTRKPSRSCYFGNLSVSASGRMTFKRDENAPRGCPRTGNPPSALTEPAADAGGPDAGRNNPSRDRYPGFSTISTCRVPGDRSRIRGS
jgi:Protein of unknown function (DUF1376)